MSCRLDHAVRAVVQHDHAPVGEPAGRGGGTAQKRGLGVGLCDQRARRERRDLDDAGERGPAACRVEQVVRRAPVGVQPASPPDAAGRHAASRQLERVQDALVKRALHTHLARDAASAADREVAGAVDRKAGVCPERLREHVGEQALREAAGIELDARRARDARRALVDVEEAPARAAARRRGSARRRERERELQRQRPAQVAHVAAVLDLVEQSAIDQSVGAHRREHHGLGEPCHQWADGDRAARIGVQQRELAVGQKARELVVPFAQPALREVGGGVRRTLWRVAFDQHLTRGAEAVKRSPGLHARAHDCEVVTADGLLLELLELEPELFSLEPDPEVEPELCSLEPALVEPPSPEPLDADEEPVDRLDAFCEEEEPEDADCVAVEAALEEPALVRSDELEVAAALRLAAAASAGSWPETSCT
jgi:hypothetical protein